jgi:hypothetical protein
LFFSAAQWPLRTIHRRLSPTRPVSRDHQDAGLMQNTMNEMQLMMAPLMQKVQQMQQEVVAELKAKNSKKKGG